MMNLQSPDRGILSADEECPQCEKSQQDEPFICSPRQSPSRLITSTRIYIVLIHVLAMTLAMYIWKQDRPPFHTISLDGQSWSPARQVIQYEIKSAHQEHRLYAGPPTPENEAAWADLTQPSYFNTSLEVLDKAGESLVNLTRAKQGGYVASLGVYHELHCIYRLRAFLYRKHYYPDLTAPQEKYLHEHLDHCLDSLRATIMCFGNAGLRSFNWNEPRRFKPEAQSNAKSLCVKWDSIHNWAKSTALAAPIEAVREEPVGGSFSRM